MISKAKESLDNIQNGSNGKRKMVIIGVSVGLACILIISGIIIGYKKSLKFKILLIKLKNMVFWNPILKSVLTVFLIQSMNSMIVIREAYNNGIEIIKPDDSQRRLAEILEMKVTKG